jgi:DNA (cytosine-5)-methyltransferase 1
VRPAASAIDWTDLGTRIGDRSRPLAAATVERIRDGLQQFAPLDDQGDDIANGTGPVGPPMLVPAGGTWNTTATTVADPMRTRTTRDTEALVTPPLVEGITPPIAVTVNHDGHGRAYPLHARPLPSRTTKIGDGIATTEAFIAMLRRNGSAMGLDEPLAAMTTARHHALVVPYRKGSAKTTADPLLTLGTRDSAALVQPEPAVEECRFRMLKPREQLRAQRFPDTYTVTGNKSEQTMQAGNAVSANVAQWLGQITTQVLV